MPISVASRWYSMDSPMILHEYSHHTQRILRSYFIDGSYQRATRGSAEALISRVCPGCVPGMIRRCPGSGIVNKQKISRENTITGHSIRRQNHLHRFNNVFIPRLPVQVIIQHDDNADRKWYHCQLPVTDGIGYHFLIKLQELCDHPV